MQQAVAASKSRQPSFHSVSSGFCVVAIINQVTLQAIGSKVTATVSRIGVSAHPYRTVSRANAARLRSTCVIFDCDFDQRVQVVRAGFA